jgi:hypothetical protein
MTTANRDTRTSAENNETVDKSQYEAIDLSDIDSRQSETLVYEEIAVTPEGNSN